MNVQIHNKSKEKTAVLYRMVTDAHICPFGLKSRDLLKRQGYKVEDHQFQSKQEADDFREEHGVKTTPQTFIEGKRIGGYDDLRAYFGKDKQQEESDETTYQPIVAMFSMALLLALATNWRVTGSLQWLPVTELFVAFGMVILAIQKLRDLFAFSNQFLGYDLLAQKWVRYAYIYPFIEGLAGVAMLTAVPELALIAAPLALFIGTVGAISVFKAVYIDKRELKCACVGGNSNVPLGFVSLSENLAMMGMSIWMLVKHLA
jgi:glutaredoxin|tara:strand:+ start:1270 stop:2049 length:780 start_codon:yes stop_codon:yes gene_type:complete